MSISFDLLVQPPAQEKPREKNDQVDQLVISSY